MIQIKIKGGTQYTLMGNELKISVIDAPREELQNKRIAELEAELNLTKQDNESSFCKITGLKARVSNLEAERDELQNIFDKYRKTPMWFPKTLVDELHGRIAELEAELKQEKEYHQFASRRGDTNYKACCELQARIDRAIDYMKIFTAPKYREAIKDILTGKDTP